MKKILLLLISYLLLFTTSCSVSQKQVNKNESLPFYKDSVDIKIYFTKSKKPGEIIFLSVIRKIPKENSVLESTLQELFLGPTKNEELRGIMTEIPVGTRLIKIEESEDELLVDVSGQYLTGGGSATMQVRYLQLYKTLNAIEPDKKLYLHVDGKSLKTIGGEGLEVSQPLQKIEDYTKKYEKTDSLQP